MDTQAALKETLITLGLRVLGGLQPASGPYKTIYLIGPARNFWHVIQGSAEYKDGQPDPIDRWSTRVLTKLAADTDATPLFPFGGPPYEPFIDWALLSGQCFQSPVQLLIHVELGLFMSFRGGLGFKELLPVPQPTQSPCKTCAGQPCLSACPVGALNKNNYDVAACHVFLDSDQGDGCMAQGCAVRRSCPVGQNLRAKAQSAFHMSYFHRKAPQ